jgi:hypothetical protein
MRNLYEKERETEEENNIKETEEILKEYELKDEDKIKETIKKKLKGFKLNDIHPEKKARIVYESLLCVYDDDMLSFIRGSFYGSCIKIERKDNSDVFVHTHGGIIYLGDYEKRLNVFFIDDDYYEENNICYLSILNIYNQDIDLGNSTYEKKGFKVLNKIIRHIGPDSLSRNLYINKSYKTVIIKLGDINWSDKMIWKDIEIRIDIKDYKYLLDHYGISKDNIQFKREEL